METFVEGKELFNQKNVEKNEDSSVNDISAP